MMIVLSCDGVLAGGLSGENKLHVRSRLRSVPQLKCGSLIQRCRGGQNERYNQMQDSAS